ncbi:MAG: hypothetical protein NDI60_09600 [Elusimicrobiales bacterium]|nr:hypothetical protein [Elusimicrobiales bacterium]
MGIWDNAFKIPEPPDPTDEEKRLLDALAEKVRRRGLGEIASFTVESTRPLHNLGAQGLVFIEPALKLLFKKEEIEKYRALLENSKAVTYLVDRLSAEPPKKEDPDVKKRP